MTDRPQHNTTRRRLTGTAFVVYWIALAAGTHWPRVTLPTGEGSDKMLHFLAYGGLAFLLCHYAAARQFLTFRNAVSLWLFVAAYGAFDEITQIPVGRHAELFDWYADVIGAALGTGTAILSLRIFDRQNSPEHH